MYQYYKIIVRSSYITVNFIQIAQNRLPTLRARGMACLRVLCSDVLQVCVTAVFYAISCYIQSCYSGPACSVTIKREQTSVRLRHECCDQPAALQRQDDELLNSWSSSAWNAASYDFLSSLQSKNTAVGYRLWITIRWKSIYINFWCDLSFPHKITGVIIWNNL